MFNEMFAGRVLVVAPHVDDEVLGCGGTLLRFRTNITHLAVVHLAATAQRLDEFARVARILGINAHHALSYEDGFFEESSKEMILELVKIIQSERPDVLLVPHALDGHVDHQSASRFTRAAIDKARYWPPTTGTTCHRVPTAMEYEVWTPLPQPTVVYDISSVFLQKLNLVKCFESQITSFPYIEFITSLNSWRGILHHRGGQAEAFGAFTI